MEPKVKFEAADGIARLTLNDPATLNACSVEMGEELHAALRRIDGDTAIRAVVLTGEGRGFSSGANLSATAARAAASDGPPDAGAALESVYNPMISAIRALRVPIVTAVNGAAAGVGCSIALMGDLIVAGESAYFLQAFRRIGLVPDGGSTWLLPHMIGRARAMEMTLLGDKIDAKTALEWGLINRVAPDAELMETAMGLARRLADGPASLGTIRKLIWAGETSDFDAQISAERHAQTAAGRTADFQEGVAAFLQKRPAVFTGA